MEILGERGSNQKFVINEVLFNHKDNMQVYVIINISTKKLRLDIPSERSSLFLQIILNKHVNHGNIIISRLWNRYNNSCYFYRYILHY